MAKNFMDHSPYKIMRFDKTKGRDFLKSVVQDGGFSKICIILFDGDTPAGFIVGMKAEPVFSSNSVAMELGWWVEPGFRNTRGSFLLYKAYEDWALRVGCSHVQGAYLPGISPDLDSFYKKRGYVQTESSYVKVLKV